MSRSLAYLTTRRSAGEGRLLEVKQGEGVHGADGDSGAGDVGQRRGDE